MLVRATAVATDRSNAVGTVELECTPHGLALAYLGTGAFREGYATAALASGTRLTVPWSEVTEARVEGDQLFLAVEEARTPLNRLTLMNFSTGDFTHHREVGRQRKLIWLAAFGAALIAITSVGLVLPHVTARAGAGAALVLGGLLASSLLLVGFLADRRLGTGLSGDAAREAFAAELVHYLPTLVRLPVRPTPAEKPVPLPDLSGFMPRTTAALVITLSAGVLGVVLTGKWLLSGEREVGRVVSAGAERPMGPMIEPAAPVVDPQAPAAAPPPAEPAKNEEPAAPAPDGPTVAKVGRCSCERSSSLLWDKPLPKLSVLVLERRLISGPERKRLEVDVAAVNNSSEDVRDLSMMVTFIEQDPPPSNRRTPVAHRAVFFEGPLGPGKAIKWGVEARGSDIEIEPPIPGDIGPGGDGAAPTNLLADLLNANHRPVRLHGALMLAYLGDPRARDGALKLKEALREDEAPYLDRLLRALGALKTCRFEVTGSGPSRQVEACIFNSSNEVKRDIGLAVRGLEGEVSRMEPTRAPPKVLAEATWAVPGELPPQEGVSVRAALTLPSGVSPTAFEASADRKDLLR